MFKGVFVAIATPFNGGRIDEEALRRHVDFLIREGVHGLVPCGTTGEASTFSHEEYSQVVKTVVSEAKGRVPIIAGAGTNCTRHAVELAKLVMEAGAGATLQVTPYYNKPTQEGLYQHFKTIAEEVPVPHVLYNVPGRTGINMLPQTVERLSKIKNIVAIKEASGDLKQIEKICEMKPANFSVLCGNDDQNLDVYKMGGVGAISVTGNVAPKKVSQVWELFSSGKTKEAEALQASIEELNKAMFIESNPIPVKTTLALMKMFREEFRLPLTKMESENKNRLQNVLKSYQLI